MRVTAMPCHAAALLKASNMVAPKLSLPVHLLHLPSHPQTLMAEHRPRFLDAAAGGSASRVQVRTNQAWGGDLHVAGLGTSAQHMRQTHMV